MATPWNISPAQWYRMGTQARMHAAIEGRVMGRSAVDTGMGLRGLALSPFQPFKGLGEGGQEAPRFARGTPDAGEWYTGKETEVAEFDWGGYLFPAPSAGTRAAAELVAKTTPASATPPTRRQRIVGAPGTPVTKTLINGVPNWVLYAGGGLLALYLLR